MALKYISSDKVALSSSVFRVMKKKVVVNLRQLRERDRYLIGLIEWVGFNQVPIDVKHGMRLTGKTKYSLGNQINLAINALLSFSPKVGEAIFKFGVLSLVASITSSFLQIFQYFIIGKVNLITILFNITIFNFSLIITVLGIISNYLEKLYIQSKNRPLYIIKKAYE
jgi:dolichol-phosphate mannosyltransferase